METIKEIEIESIAGGGDGVGRWRGKTVFVPLTAPGDRVRVRIVKEGDRFDRGEIAEIFQPGPDRVQPPCEYYGDCGGCRLMHLSYPAQLEAKRRIVHEALARIGRLEPPPFEVLPSPQRLGYRDRIRLQRRGERLGFYAAGSQRVVEIGACLLADDRIQRALAKADQWLPALRKTAQLEIRGEAEGYRPVPLEPGARPEFRQVNPEANRVLGRALDEAVGVGDRSMRVLELFCGDGNLTLRLLKRGFEVVAVESNRKAVVRLRRKAEEMGLDSRLTALAEDLNRDAVWTRKEIAGRRFDLAVLDPPRTGAAKLMRPLAEINPAAVTYVSCDPATLARDLRTLGETASYRLESLVCVDMFPQTAHVETIARLARGPVKSI